MLCACFVFRIVPTGQNKTVPRAHAVIGESPHPFRRRQCLNAQNIIVRLTSDARVTFVFFLTAHTRTPFEVTRFRDCVGWWRWARGKGTLITPNPFLINLQSRVRLTRARSDILQQGLSKKKRVFHRVTTDRCESDPYSMHAHNTQHTRTQHTYTHNTHT